jgi:hypothetical protein
MKIRVSSFYSEDEFTPNQVKEQLTESAEAISFPLIISNNECAATLGSETAIDDSPLSFIMKFKASFVRPPGSPTGFAGFRIPESEYPNTKTNDAQSLHFRSVNENHHDLEVTDNNRLDQLVADICRLPEFHQRFDWSKVSAYLVRTVNDPEWQAFYQQNSRWNKFKNRSLTAAFKRKHCEFDRTAMASYAQTAPNDFEDDLKFLKQHNAVSDTNHLRTLKALFPHIF